MSNTKAKNTICLWFNKDAQDAARFYAATFPNSEVTAIHKAPGDFPGGKEGEILTVEFTVFGLPCLGLNGGPEFSHTEAFSFQIATDTQAARIGKLLDPLADKLIVSTALIMLLAIGWIPVRWGSWMVVVIVGRELAVTGLRGIASSHGQVVAATGPGKLKTIAQTVATAALLFHYETLGLPAQDIGMTLLAIATVLTLWSGYLYFSDYFGWRSPGPADPKSE